MTLPGGKAQRVASTPAGPGPPWVEDAGAGVCHCVPSMCVPLLRGFAAPFFPARDAVWVPLLPGCVAGAHIPAGPAWGPAAG